MNRIACRLHRLTPPALLLALGVVLFRPAIAAGNDSPWETDPYRLGQGLYFPQQGLRVGGYADLHYYDLDDGPRSASIDDLSLIVTKDFGSRWKLLSETDLSEAAIITGGASAHRTPRSRSNAFTSITTRVLRRHSASENFSRPSGSGI